MIFEAIKKMVNSNHNKPLDVLIAEKTQEIKDTLDGGMQVPVVKSVQRGKSTISANYNSKSTTSIPIASVDKTKTVLVRWDYLGNSSFDYNKNISVEIDNENIVVTFDNSSNGSTVSLIYDWEIVEFY